MSTSPPIDLDPSGSGATDALWFGRPIGLAEASIFMFMAVVAITGTFLQPLLLGNLVAAGRLSLEGLGRAASAEMLSLGIASIVAGAILPPVRLRLVAMSASAALLLVHLASTHASDWIFVGLRAVAGLLEGILLWLPMSLIARSRRAGRWTAIYAIVSNLAPATIAALLSFGLLASLKENAGYYALALLAGAGVVAGAFLPDSLTPLPKAKIGTTGMRWSGAVWIMLLRTALVMSSYGALWSYLGPISAASGHAPWVMNATLSIALGCQMTGALCAAGVADRLDPMVVLGIGAGLMMLGVGALLALPGPPIFIGIVAAAAVFMAFSHASETLLALAVDPSRRSAVIISGVQLIGGSAGPLCASFAVARGGVGAAPLAFLFLNGVVLLLLFYLYIRRRSAAQDIAT